MHKTDKKEWLMMLAVVAVTLLISLLAIRSFAPQWLGLPVDLRVVQVDERVPPFYENIFHQPVDDEGGFLLNDPYTLVRARPLAQNRGQASGPHDLLGFRNRSVPGYTDILILGDSQTYGNNVTMYENWPHVLARQTEDVSATVYSMATGGWGAVQYLDLFTKGVALDPEVVVVAFYSGNDPLESYKLAYSVERWKSLRVIDGVTDDDLPPPMVFPPAAEDQWPVTFADGSALVFSPKLRLRSNMLGFGATRAGWAVMKLAARLISERATAHGIKLVFVTIPTKELVYASRIEQEGIEAPELYRRLLQDEGENIRNFSTYLAHLAGKPLVVDLLAPLQQAALTQPGLYPEGADGHPLEPGYRLIGETIAAAVRPLLTPVRDGLYSAVSADGDPVYLLLRAGMLRSFETPALALDNGWRFEDAVPLEARDAMHASRRGPIATVDPDAYGPAKQ